MSVYVTLSQGLRDEETRAEHFSVIRKIFDNYDLKSMKDKANQQIKQEDSLEQQWIIVIAYLVSATAKDFTVMMRILELKESQD